MILKEIPIYERPREKVINYGVSYLSNAELLAIILRTGTKNNNVLRMSEEVLYKLSSIKDLGSITLSELTEVKGIGETKAVTLLATVELGRRILNAGIEHKIIKSSKNVYEHMKTYFYNASEEHLYGIYLNAKGGIISTIEITKGTVNSTYMDPDNIFKWHYKLSSSAIILVHNHPSGDPTPSIPDVKMTNEIVKKAKVLDIKILDHIVIGKTYYSMRENEHIYKIFKS